MDLEAALDAVFVQAVPHLQFRTCGPTFRPSTYDACEEQVVWNCDPHIPGTATPRPGLSGLWDQMALLCPSTTYILLPSQPINELYGDDIELLLDVAETLKRIHDTLNVDMYVILIFKDVAPQVCQQYAHLFQADFALQGYVGHLIYQSLLYDLDTPEYHRRSTHFYRYPGLNTRRQILSPVPRCSVLPRQCVPALLDLARSPLKVTWKGSIFSSANEEYTGFRFLHSSSVGMPVGPVTIASCNPPGTTQSSLARTRANFVITLDITSCDKTIELIESWRTLNMEVFLEYDEKLFIASWVPPRGYINHWHITACSVQISPSSIPPKVGPMLPTRSKLWTGSQTPALTVLPSDIVDLPVLSLSDTDKRSKRAMKPQSVLFGQTKSFNLNNQNSAFVGAANSLQSVSRSKKTTIQKDIIGLDNVLVDNKTQAVVRMKGSSVRPFSGMKSKLAQNGSRVFRVNLQSKSKHLTKIRRDGKSSTKSRSRPRVAAKVDPRLVKVAMRQYFANHIPSSSRTSAQEAIYLSKNYPRSWSGLGHIASDFDERDFSKSSCSVADGFLSAFHGIDYQAKDATAEVETAIFTSGIEFTSAPIKPERMSQVLRALNKLRFDSTASIF